MSTSAFQHPDALVAKAECDTRISRERDCPSVYTVVARKGEDRDAAMRRAVAEALAGSWELARVDPPTLMCPACVRRRDGAR